MTTANTARTDFSSSGEKCNTANRKSPLLAIAQKLREEALRLELEMKSLKAELAGLQSDLTRVRRASSLLRGGAEKPKARRTRKTAASKQEVIRAVTAVLGEQQPLDSDRLKQATKEHLRLSGKSLVGFALRIKEALAETIFVKAEAGYRLADTPTSHGNDKRTDVVSHSGGTIRDG